MMRKSSAFNLFLFAVVIGVAGWFVWYYFGFSFNAHSTIPPEFQGESVVHEDAFAGQEFTIQLEANYTTGYKLVPDFDSSMVALEGNDFTLHSNALGVGGNETFQFRARRRGKTYVAFYAERGDSRRPEALYEIVIR